MIFISHLALVMREHETLKANAALWTVASKESAPILVKLYNFEHFDQLGPSKRSGNGPPRYKVRFSYSTPQWILIQSQPHARIKGIDGFHGLLWWVLDCLHPKQNQIIYVILRYPKRRVTPNGLWFLVRYKNLMSNRQTFCVMYTMLSFSTRVNAGTSLMNEGI